MLGVELREFEIKGDKKTVVTSEKGSNVIADELDWKREADEEDRKEEEEEKKNIEHLIRNRHWGDANIIEPRSYFLLMFFFFSRKRSD